MLVPSLTGLAKSFLQNKAKPLFRASFPPSLLKAAWVPSGKTTPTQGCCSFLKAKPSFERIWNTPLKSSLWELYQMVPPHSVSGRKSRWWLLKAILPEQQSLGLNGNRCQCTSCAVLTILHLPSTCSDGSKNLQLLQCCSPGGSTRRYLGWLCLSEVCDSTLLFSVVLFRRQLLSNAPLLALSCFFRQVRRNMPWIARETL